MRSWAQSLDYDPLGDCCSHGMNRDYWRRQSEKIRNRAKQKRAGEKSPTLTKETTTADSTATASAANNTSYPVKKQVSPTVAKRRLIMMLRQTAHLNIDDTIRFKVLHRKYMDHGLSPKEYREFRLLEMR